MSYILASEAMRVVEKNDRGGVTYRKRYKRGQEVDVSHIDDAQVESLLASGALVESDSDEAEAVQEATDTPEGSEVTGDTTGDTGEPLSPAALPQNQPEEPDEQEDRYDAMSYPDLQREAKERDLNGGGSAEDLRERLRADDAESTDSTDE